MEARNRGVKDWLKKWGEPLPILVVIIMLLGGIWLGRISSDLNGVKTGVTTLAARTESRVTRSLGGKLTSQDARVTVAVAPETTTQDVILRYQPMSKSVLPAVFPDKAINTGYEFCVTALNPSGVQLSELPLKEGKRLTLSVIYTDNDLKLAGGVANRLSIANWDETTGEWEVISSVVVGHTVRTETGKLGQFALIAKPQ